MPVIASLAQEAGALTVGVVTLPFSFEGSRRRSLAQDGLARLRPNLDAVIVISNDRLLQVAPKTTKIADTFKLADDTLNQGIHGIADLILTPGFINLDFADVRSVMHRAGPALMSTGRATGEGAALRAVEAAMRSPLLDAPIDGARGILLNITGGPALSLHQVNVAAHAVSASASPECNFIFGTVIHPKLEDEVRVTLIATGYGGG
jgi:cell division protein FtsZ